MVEFYEDFYYILDSRKIKKIYKEHGLYIKRLFLGDYAICRGDTVLFRTPYRVIAYCPDIVLFKIEREEHEL